jgi:hypothetical protein
MKKSVWDMTPDDIGIIGNKRYRWKRDFNKRYPRFGTMLTREIVNIDNPADKQLVLRGFEIEIEENPEAQK